MYGADHDDPGPKPGHAYRELCAGPLDGLLLDVTGWDDEQLAEGAALLTDLGRYGPGGRAHYEPRPADPLRWTGRATATEPAQADRGVSLPPGLSQGPRLRP